MTAEHNHPPRCCCEGDTDPRGSNERIDCPLCVDHGELAQLGKECPSCHTTDGHPHTDYCNLTKPLAGNIQVRDLHTPTEWAKLEDCLILDPDGWRGHNAKSFDEPITQAEYERRRAISTCRFGGNYWSNNSEPNKP